MKCTECGKEIEQDFLPSNFCKECVDLYIENVKKEDKKAQLHPEFH